MLELNPFRKNKVNLQDYDYQKDIQNRLIMGSFNSQDLEVLEELLYGLPKLSIGQLAQDLVMDESVLVEVLQKLAPTGLFVIQDYTIHLNKEMRKYFEAQLQKFEEGFVPGMEYLQTLLRKVPFHILLSWYPIPRTSNNIFDSLVEKYLLTPQIFQRYLMELNFGHPKMASIIEDVYNAKDFEMLGKDLKKKHGLSDEEFEEILLHLEFNFVCCLVYKNIDDKWEQVVTPFQEWRDYLKFLRDSKPTPVDSSDAIVPYRERDFAFIEDMTQFLKILKATPLSLDLDEHEKWAPDKASLKTLTKKIHSLENKTPEEASKYLSKVIEKLIFVKLAKVESRSLVLNEGYEEWLALSIENRALAVYKHTLTRLDSFNFPSEIITERNIREIEKTVNTVLNLGWIEFEDFMKSMLAPLSKDSRITLKKAGRGWKYTLPVYSEQEYLLIRQTILEWLFEAGLVSIGFSESKTYFRVTPFGQMIFS